MEELLRWVKYNRVRASANFILFITMVINLLDGSRTGEKIALTCALLLPLFLIPEIKKYGSKFLSYYKKL